MYTTEQIAALSKENCFSVWYDPKDGRYYPDYDRSDGSIWICDVDREITVKTLTRMTELMLPVIDEYDRKGYLKR